MTLEKMFALIDDKLSDVFHTRKPEPMALRAPVLKAIERTRSQFAKAEPVRGPKWFKLANDVVAFSPTLRGGHPLPINGQTTVFVASRHFPELLDHFQEAVVAGEFDDQLADPGNGAGSIAAVEMPSGRKRRDPDAPKTGWSDERRAKFRETVAARKAAGPLSA